MSAAIVGPMLGLMLVTVAVAVLLVVRRVGHMREARIGPQRLAHHADKVALMPQTANQPAENLANLSELPILFYAVCLVLFIAGAADVFDVAAAWLFTILRALHSIVHCTFNRVMLRFYCFAASAVVLLALILRTVWRFVDGTLIAA